MRFVKVILLVLFSILIFPKVADAAENSFVTIVNPVRGEDFWTHQHQVLDTVKKQYEVISENNLASTWILRFDAYNNNEIAGYFKNLPQNQELGIFFEVTPALTNTAGVNYNESGSWHRARSVFLTGYSVEDRYKLIDTAFGKFKNTFGYYPKSVGAWWIDANSLGYMRSKYQITTNLAVADQFSTDDYQVWGMPFSTAFYPSAKNALVPAQSSENKLGPVTIQWAQRDPYNGYGPGVQESTYSVQANDYQSYHDLGISYFEELFKIYAIPNFYNQFGQLTVGLENDFSWDDFGNEYTKQIEFVSRKRSEGITNVVSMQNFANWYISKFPEISPANLIYSDDPLGSEGKAIWFSNQYYRIGYFYHPELYGSAIRDLRSYDDSQEEECFKKSCEVITLAKTISPPLDEATYNNRWTLDEKRVSDFNIEQNDNKIKVSYLNAAGKLRTLEFAPRDLFIDGQGLTIPQAILNVLTSESGKVKVNSDVFSLKVNLDLISLLFNFGKFTLFSLLFFVLPGVFVLNFLKINLSKINRLVLGTILGIVMFTLLNYLFSWVKLTLVANLIIVLLGIYQLFLSRGNFKIPKIDFNLRLVIIFLLILAGSASQLATVVKSGLVYDFGFGFWGPNGHDAIWHLSLIENLAGNFPPQNSILAGEPLTNYHYFYDLLLAKTKVLTGISANDLYFRFFPLVLSLLLGLTTFKLTKKMSGSFVASILATFLIYFGGSWGWVVSYFRNGDFGGESMFWANQSISYLLNPPFAISVVIFLAGLMLFKTYIDEKDNRLIIPISILWGSLIEFKAYAGVLVLGSLLIITFWEILKHQKTFYLKLLIPSGLISLFVFLPNNIGSTNLFVFEPFWFVNTMAQYQDRLNWVRLSNALSAYQAQGIWHKLVLAEILGLIIFLIGNLGTRVLVFGQIYNWVKNKFKFEQFTLFITVFSILGVLSSLLFIQKGTNWNTIQFFYYFLVVSSIFSAIFFAQLVRNLTKPVTIFAVVIFVLLTVPTTYQTLTNYLPPRPPSRLPLAEFEALQYLRQQPDGFVLARVFDEKSKNRFSEPVPLLAYVSNAYVSAFSGKSVFIEDEVNLGILGADFEERVVGAKEFFRTKDETFAGDFLRKNNIKYIYVAKYEHFDPNEQNLGIEKLFENNEAKIYEVF